MAETSILSVRGLTTFYGAIQALHGVDLDAGRVVPVLPDLVRYEEAVTAQEIKHALRFTLDRTANSYVHPATHAAGVNTDKRPPLGIRVRLKASFDTSKFTGPAKVLVTAMKKYGMILADGGNIPLVAESVKVHKDANAAETWDGLLGPTDVGFLKPGDFEVVAIPKENPAGAAGWYQTKAEYEGQLKKPLGCNTIVQP